MASSPDTAPRSTVVALVGPDSDVLLSGLSDVPALVALSLREAEPAAAARRLTAVSTPYVVHDADGEVREFDHLIVATPALEARDLLAPLEGTEALRRELARFEYFKTLIAIHGDRRLMPADEEDWSVVNIRHDGQHSYDSQAFECTHRMSVVHDKEAFAAG